MGGMGVPPVNSSPAGIHGAGGIGGLLAVYDTKGTSSTSDDVNYSYFYDGNGNVGQLASVTAASLSSAWAVKYE